jgi:hypothetical protein
MGATPEDSCGDTHDVGCSGEAMLQSSSSSTALNMGVGLLKRSSSAIVAPILVNCSGTSSDEGESSSTTDLGCEPAKRTSTASSCDAYSSQQDGGPCVTPISFEAMAKGHYKTGVRYCMETWPENVILRVGAAVAPQWVGVHSAVARHASACQRSHWASVTRFARLQCVVQVVTAVSGL